MTCTLKVKRGIVAAEKGDAIIIPVFEGPEKLSGAAKELDDAAAGIIHNVLTSGDFTGERYRTTVLYTQNAVPIGRIILVGLGKENDATLDIVRGAGGKGFRCARDLGIKKVIVTAVPVMRDWSAGDALEAFLTGGLLGIYQFKELVTTEREKIKRIGECLVIASDADHAKAFRQAVDRCSIIRDAVYLARDLVSLPANKKTPTILADRARNVAQKVKLKCKIVTEAQAEKMGMGAFTAVARGSNEPATFIILEYTAGTTYGQPVVLIGKGITFDSGGISLKPPANMEQMKDDMAGGAAVLAVMQAVARLKLPVNVVGLIPATENLPGGKAYKPGDVLTSLSGQTIEVISTDAEGRLILADALTYALRYKPRAMVDIATLTGACVTALGNYVAGMMGNDDTLLDKVRAASDHTGEKIWPLPLWEEYADNLKSDIADFKNVGNRTAGAIVGGVFLNKFVKDTPWVHVDIAGPAWQDKDRPYIPKGASGFGVRLLLELLAGM